MALVQSQQKAGTEHEDSLTRELDWDDWELACESIEAEYRSVVPRTQTSLH